MILSIRPMLRTMMVVAIGKRHSHRSARLALKCTIVRGGNYWDYHITYLLNYVRSFEKTLIKVLLSIETGVKAECMRHNYPICLGPSYLGLFK
jgi:hypothetical protein